MAIKDLVKLNGNTTNLPVRREEDTNNYNYPSVYREMHDWMNQWNQWFDSFFGRSFGLSPFKDLESRWGSNRNWGTGQGTFVPSINVSDTGNEMRVTAELPGLDENDIELSISNDALLIKGHKQQEHEDKSTNYYRMERSYGSFQRSIPLPQGIDQNKVQATFGKGVLTITAPKLPELQSRTKKIQIKTEK